MMLMNDWKDWRGSVHTLFTALLKNLPGRTDKIVKTHSENNLLLDRDLKKGLT
jgi:hypothetical protein